MADAWTLTFSVMQAQEYLSSLDVKLIGPFMISMDGPVTMGNACFTFDLTGDGSEKSLGMPSQGAGFLFLDRNANGRIDYGRELFGTQSGDGFADLAVL